MASLKHNSATAIVHVTTTTIITTTIPTTIFKASRTFKNFCVLLASFCLIAQFIQLPLPCMSAKTYAVDSVKDQTADALHLQHYYHHNPEHHYSAQRSHSRRRLQRDSLTKPTIQNTSYCNDVRKVFESIDIKLSGNFDEKGKAITLIIKILSSS
uniref:Uncharacterized protein n=1 Tax=Glossina austeni TaxID=7395 RepID=A0A1A9UP62_GLOAU